MVVGGGLPLSHMVNTLCPDGGGGGGNATVTHGK